MLSKATTLEGYHLHSLDGDIGKVKDFYFDDQHWAIRYLVAETGNWLTGRQVLLSPYALVAVKPEQQHIAVALTRAQIESSPSLESDKPVSRQFELSYYGYYGWPQYWDGPYMWGAFPYIARDSDTQETPTPAGKVWDPHLRSAHDVTGHHIRGTDGEIGHVKDLVVDDETWAIRYLIVATRNWWPGKLVLVAPQWITRVSWREATVFANMSREAIKAAPEYTEESLLTREYETGLHRHYDRHGYWVEEPVAAERSR